MMKYRTLAPALGLLAAIFCSSCSEPNITYVEPVKMFDSDPFKNEIVESQLIEIDGSADNTVEGKNGTVVVVPKGCFRRKDGSEVTGKIQLELAEALHPGDMLTSNLTTASNGQPLETGGMIYMNAKADGEQLGVANDNPLYVYIPADQKIPGMQVYTGTRDKNGNMNWINPQPLRELLATLPLGELDFLPDGFADKVRKGLPFRNFKVATRGVIDTLYYKSDDLFEQLSYESTLLLNQQLSNITEPMYSDVPVLGTRIMHDSTASPAAFNPDDCPMYNESTACCYVDPKQVKTLLDEQFANTFIATRAFEKRIKTMHSICGRKLVHLYPDNLEKELWEVDSMVADRLKGEPDKEQIFRKFASEKLTNVKDADKKAALLKGFFSKKLAENQATGDKLKKQAMEEAKAHSDQVTQTIINYRQVLQKRETYRMEGYGFERTELGWINVDVGTADKEWEPLSVDCYVSNGTDFDRVYCYLFIPDKKSLHKFYQKDKTTFNTGGNNNQTLPVPKYKTVNIIAVGYIGDSLYMDMVNWETASFPGVKLTLDPTTKEFLGDIMKLYAGIDNVDKNNNILIDLAFQDTLYKEEVRRKTLDDEMQFLTRLQKTYMNCCKNCSNDLVLTGERIFNAKCSSCHSAKEENGNGPGLACASERIPAGEWRYKFITDPAGMIASGDAYTVALINKYASIMPAQNLTRQEIDAVFAYLDCHQCPSYRK